MRTIVCHVLIVLQAAVPLLCHGHVHGPDCDGTDPNAIAPRRWIPPHIHTHHLPFWPFGDDEEHEDDHPDGPVPGGPATLAAEVGAPLASASALSFTAADTAAIPAPVAFLDPPSPVALSPPAVGPPGLHPPLYLVTLCLLI